MKPKLFVLLLLMTLKLGNLYAQSADTSDQVAANWFNEAKHTAAGQKIWPLPLYGPMYFVDPDTRSVWANMPDNEGVLKPEGKIYKGTLPKSIVLANTSVTWGGRTWSMMLWPLPAGHDDRLNLLMHESFHRIQEQLHLPAHSPTAGHLDSREGRICFFMELQALKSALSKPVNERKADLENALLFRKKRELLFPETFKNEQLLEASEGVAEYTGVILGRPKDSILTHLQMVVDNAEKKESLIRSSPYITGPLYGCLLHDVDPAWTLKIDSNFTFSALIKKYYHTKEPGNNIDVEIKRISGRYNGDAITTAENLKYEERQKLQQQYIDLFTVKPVLIISLVKMNVGFNPSNLFDLGKYGTVYPTMTVKDVWGELNVTATGALMKDWQLIYLPVQNPISATTQQIVEENGWKLTLNNGWKIIHDGLNYKLINE